MEVNLVSRSKIIRHRVITDKWHNLTLITHYSCRMLSCYVTYVT